MSTKIYEAYKIPIEKINDFIDNLRPQIFDIAAEKIKQIMPEIKSNIIEDFIKTESYLKDVPEDKVRFRYIIQKIEEQSKKIQKNWIFDFDYALNIWLLGDYAYIIPVDNLGVKNQLLPDYTQDFSYWNNTDLPEGISDEEWEVRASTWEKLNCGVGLSSHNARRLMHSIIDFSGIYGDFDAKTQIRNRIFGDQDKGLEAL